MEEVPRPEVASPEVVSEKAEYTAAESVAETPADAHKDEGKELAASTPTPTPSKKNAVYPALAATLSKTDITIERLNRLLSTSSGLGAILSTTSYTTSTLHYVLSSRPLQDLLSRSQGGQTQNQTQTQAQKLQPLLSLSSLISETRTTLRLLDLLPLWSWGSSTLRSPPQDPFLRGLALLQVFVNVVYQAMENVAFLAEKGVISKRWVEKWGIGGIGRWYIWSTRAWLGHVLLEFVRLGRERSLRLRREEKEKGKDGGEGGEEEKRVAREREVLSWKKSLVNNLCWASLCVHWSLENGAGVPEEVTGFISLLAVLWGVRDKWRATAL